MVIFDLMWSTDVVKVLKLLKQVTFYFTIMFGYLIKRLSEQHSQLSNFIFNRGLDMERHDPVRLQQLERRRTERGERWRMRGNLPVEREVERRCLHLKGRVYLQTTKMLVRIWRVFIVSSEFSNINETSFTCLISTLLT